MRSRAGPFTGGNPKLLDGGPARRGPSQSLRPWCEQNPGVSRAYLLRIVRRAIRRRVRCMVPGGGHTAAKPRNGAGCDRRLLVDSPDQALVTELTQSLMKDMPRDGQPLFTSMLSLYVVEISLLQEALAASAAADRSHALRCSEYALDFYLQLSDLRREVTGVKIDYADPGRDVRDFESDAEAAAEADRQLADAASLQSDALDVDERRATSSAHGRRVLGAVMNQLERPQ